MKREEFTWVSQVDGQDSGAWTIVCCIPDALAEIWIRSRYGTPSQTFWYGMWAPWAMAQAPASKQHTPLFVLNLSVFARFGMQSQTTDKGTLAYSMWMIFSNDHHNYSVRFCIPNCISWIRKGRLKEVKGNSSRIPGLKVAEIRLLISLQMLQMLRIWQYLKQREWLASGQHLRVVEAGE